MKQVTMYQLRDGRLCSDRGTAVRNAENSYHDAIRRLTSKIVCMTKESELHEFIHDNLAKFTELAELKKDMELEEDEG